MVLPKFKWRELDGVTKMKKYGMYDGEEPDEETDEDKDDEDYYDECDDDSCDDCEFANPGSALRKATRDNPRIYPCPTCGREDMLTAEDVVLGYQCDACADRDERGW